MEKISLDDIVGISTYEQKRDAYRREIIDLKKKRRVLIGDKVSLVFENRDTVIFQIQEMVRVERITDLDLIREEINVYNELIPNPGELKATLFLEIEDQAHMRAELLKFLGIDEHVSLQIGDDCTVRAQFEEGRSKEDKISAVQYITFALSPDEIEQLSRQDVKVVIDHENYKAETRLSPETKGELLKDLAA